MSNVTYYIDEKKVVRAFINGKSEGARFHYPTRTWVSQCCSRQACIMTKDKVATAKEVALELGVPVFETHKKAPSEPVAA